MIVPLMAVMKKELTQAFRDKRMAAILVVVPIIQLTVLGYAVNLEVDRVPTVVCDQDGSPESRELVRGLVADRTLEKVAETRSAEEASRMLEDGTAAAAVVIPAGFGRDQARRMPSQVQVLIDGTDPNRAQISANTASMYLLDRAMSLSLARMNEAFTAQGRVVQFAQVKMSPRILYNPRMKSTVYMVPGVAAILLLMVTTIVTAMGIAREREFGTMEQILVTPIKPGVLLLGKCLPFAIVGLVAVAGVIAVGAWLFDVPIRGSLGLIFFGASLYLLTTLGVGVLVSTVSRTQQQAILGGFFFLLPAMLLAGFMTPIDNMPAWIRPITYLDPVRYFLEIQRGVLLKGATLVDILPQLGALAVFGAATLSFATLRFKKRMG